jgi:hypothetical protein
MFNGWPAQLMNGRSRWEIFEMVQPVPEHALAPHLEDVWVRSLRPCNSRAAPEVRCAILQAGLAPDNTPIFGVELMWMRSGAQYLSPGTGNRSLATVMVRSAELQFTVDECQGAGESRLQYHVRLNLPRQQSAILAVTDHFLLCQAEQHSPDLDTRRQFLDAAVRAMGERIYVRLGLSRAISFTPDQPGHCWLMADGFFSPDNPQS